MTKVGRYRKKKTRASQVVVGGKLHMCGKDCAGSKQETKMIDCDFPFPIDSKCAWTPWSDCLAMTDGAKKGQR